MNISADLIDSMGSDLRVVNAARVSFDTQSSYEQCRTNGTWHLPERDQKLIRYLAKHNHFTPFTHPQITLRETVPIFVARQRFKHVVGFTYNEVSRRYVDDTPQFYEPDSWRARAENVKQGSSEQTVDLGWEIDGQSAIDFLNETCRLTYEMLLATGVCPEQARMVLPQSMMTSYYVTGSLAAFSRAYKQRSDSHAQQEIQELAKCWDRIIRPLFPVSWSALVDAR